MLIKVNKFDDLYLNEVFVYHGLKIENLSDNLG